MPQLSGRSRAAVFAAALAALLAVGCSDTADRASDRALVRPVERSEVPTTPALDREPAVPRVKHAKKHRSKKHARRKASAGREGPALASAPSPPAAVTVAPAPSPPAAAAPRRGGSRARSNAGSGGDRPSPPTVTECNPRCP
jgi:hypothetical protein